MIINEMFVRDYVKHQYPLTVAHEGSNSSGSDGNDGDGDESDGDDGSDDGGDGNSDDGDDDSGDGQEVEIEEITIDNETFEINEDGAAIDKDGNVKYTKEQLEELEKGNDGSDGDGNEDGDGDDFSIEDVEKITNIEIKKDGKKLEFDTTPEGFAQREVAVFNLGKQQGESGALNSLFSNNPEIHQAYKYLAINGSLKGFGEKKSYADYKFDDLSIDQKTALIKEDLSNKGVDETVSKDLISKMVDAGTIDTQAKASLNSLKTKEKEDEKSLDEQYAQQLKNKEKLRNNYYKSVKSIVNSGKVKDLTIPKTFIREVDGEKLNATVDEFVAYMTEPIHENKQNGSKYTAYDIARFEANKERTNEDDVIEALGLFLGNKDLMGRILKQEARRSVIRRKVKKRITGTGKPTGRLSDDSKIILR